MKTSKLRITSLILALLMLFSLAIPVSASDPRALMSLGDEPAMGNLDNHELSYVAPVLHQRAYLSFSASSHYRFSNALFYLKRPYQNDFVLIGELQPRNYVRYGSCAFVPDVCGEYRAKIILTLKGSNQQMSGELSFTVKEPPANTASSANTYSHNGTRYQVVENFSSKYFYSQLDYPRFLNSYGKNVGCTATAECIAYSSYHGCELSPNSVRWSGGTYWDYSQRLVLNGRTYYGNTFSAAEALPAIAEAILNQGKPVIVGVKYHNSTSDHVVTCVGIRTGADRNNLSMRDILIVDPYGGSCKTLADFRSIDTTWALRVPIEN